MTDDLTALTRALTRHLNRITADGPTLMRRAAIDATTDGYPTTASGAPPSTAPSARLDEDGTIDVDYADPTGRTVITRLHGTRPDPIRANGTRFIRHLHDAETALHRAITELDAATPRGALDTDADDGYCISCARDAGYREPVSRYAKHCRWCGAFNSANGMEPPIELITARHRGIRLYDRDIQAAMIRVRGHGKRKAG